MRHLFDEVRILKGVEAARLLVTNEIKHVLENTHTTWGMYKVLHSRMSNRL